MDTASEQAEDKKAGASQEDAFPSETPEGLAKEKQAKSVFDAHDNTAGFQLFIQNANIGKELYQLLNNTADLQKRANKSYDLRKADECAAFFECYKGGEYTCIAIILCTFEVVSLGDLPELKEKLIERLPIPQGAGEEEKEAKGGGEDSYLSLNSILAVVGGKLFVSAEGQRCVGLGDKSEEALHNVWEQFPSIRSHIVAWLMQVSETFEYRTSFDAYQITSAFARVISMDFLDAKRRIFPRLYSNAKNLNLLAALSYEIYEKMKLRGEILELVLQWAHSESAWLWKSACLVYIYSGEAIGGTDFENDLSAAIETRLLDFTTEDFVYTALVLRQSANLRTMLATAFFNHYSAAKSRGERALVANVYMKLLRYCYYKVNAENGALPLAACDTKEQQKMLAPVVRQVMSTYGLRRQLYAILSAYLKEVAAYHLPATVLKHIAAYFCNMMGDSEEMKRDVRYFLQGCQGGAAQEIRGLLRRV